MIQHMTDDQTVALKEQIRMRLLREAKEPTRLVPVPPAPHFPEQTELQKLQEVLDDIGIEYDTEEDEYGVMLQLETGCFNASLDHLQFDGDGFYVG